MSTIRFTKTMLLVLGVICLLLASMCLYSGVPYGLQMGVAGYILGAILLILAAAFGMEKNTVISKTKRLCRVIGVILITLVLHTAGIWAMSNIHWIAGVALFLIGLANLLFLTPAAKGFVANQ